MRKYLFYKNEDGGTQCLFAETAVEMIEATAQDIKILEGNSYKECLAAYEGIMEVNECVDLDMAEDIDIYRAYYGWRG